MAKLAKALSAAAGNAAGDKVYVEDVFSTYLYDGTGSTLAINNGIDLSDKGGLVWIKSRLNNYGHRLVDTARGVTKVLESYDTSAEATETGSVTAFNSNGFTVGNQAHTNGSGYELASWTFAKQKGFFDVVTYAGNGSTQAISHNLGSVPKMIIVKSTDGAGQNWRVYHVSLGNTDFLNLNLTTDKTAGVAWNNTTPTDSVFSVGNGYNTNDNGFNYVAYLFGDDAIFGDGGDEAIIKCGSYTGNSSTPGPQVNCGFEPQWVLIKRTSAAAEWQLLDNMRGVVTGGNDQILHPDASAAEYPQNVIQFNATGFEPVGGSSNTNVGDYIYMAIRRGPMKEPSAGTDVFNGVLTNSDSSGFTGFPVSMGFPVDLPLVVYTTLAAGRLLVDRLRGATAREQPSTGMIKPNSANAQVNTGEVWGADSMTGYRIYGHNYQRICYGFRRYPKVFDIAVNTGTGSATQVAHNLTVIPELIITKRTDASEDWFTIAQNGGSASSWSVFYAGIQSNAARNEAAADYSSTITATQFNMAVVCANVNGGTYASYLFATLAGISKVGNYTGTGNTLNVDCGFSGGARWVMIKRIDATGDWYVYDSLRGIVAGDDPWFTMNSTDVQVTNTDYIDPLAAGFTVTNTASTTLNVNGGTYLFLAFA